MKRILIAAAVVALAGCQTEPHYTIVAPPAPQQPGPRLPQPPPPPVTSAGPLTKAGVGRYMDGQETDLRALLRGKGIVVARRGETLLVTIPSDRLFERQAIGWAGRDVLGGIARVLAHYDHAQVEVGAYTDLTGSPEQNLAVSQKRAAAVAAFLGASGVAPARLSSQGYGATNIKVSRGSDPRNRRIEIKITPTPG